MTEKMSPARWPAMMKRKTVAEYCEIAEADVERRIFAGQLRPPVGFGKQPHWHKETIDRYLADLAGEGEADWERTLRENVKL